MPHIDSHTYAYKSPQSLIQHCIYCIQCYQTPPRGNMCLCLWLQNILPRRIMSQTQQSFTGIGLCVCACGTAVDSYCCHLHDRRPPSGPSSLWLMCGSHCPSQCLPTCHPFSSLVIPFTGFCLLLPKFFSSLFPHSLPL